MVTLFIPHKKESNINIANVVITRLNMDYRLDEGFLKIHPKFTNLCKRINANGECYGLYLTYKCVSNIEKIIEIINEHDDLPVTHKFNYMKQGNYYLVY